MKRRGHTDPVDPELREYVLARDQGCVVAKLVAAHLVSRVGPCREQWSTGRPTGVWTYVVPHMRDRLLTIAHVRDRFGGRMGRRPASTRQTLVAVCWGHHLGDPVVDRRDVRTEVQRYLEELEGSPAAPSWSRLGVQSSLSDEGREE